MLYKHIPGSSLGGNVMTQEQSILKEMPYLYLVSLWIWINVTKNIYTWSKKWKYFIADNILGKEEFFDEKETGKVVKITKDQRLSVEKILDIYGNDILRLAYSYLQNMQDSEDILQETDGKQYPDSIFAGGRKGASATYFGKIFLRKAEA